SLAAFTVVGYAHRRSTILPLPSDGRGRGEGECVSKTEVVFARVLSSLNHLAPLRFCSGFFAASVTDSSSFDERARWTFRPGWQGNVCQRNGDARVEYSIPLTSFL